MTFSLFLGFIASTLRACPFPRGLCTLEVEERALMKSSVDRGSTVVVYITSKEAVSPGSRPSPLAELRGLGGQEGVEINVSTFSFLFFFSVVAFVVTFSFVGLRRLPRAKVRHDAHVVRVSNAAAPYSDRRPVGKDESTATACFSHPRLAPFRFP